MQSSPLSMRKDYTCNSNVLTDVKEIGQGELLSKDDEGKLIRDKKGNELEGKQLADKAISQFEKNKEEQKHLGRLTTKEQEGLARARNSQEKAKYIYRLLRRVEIVFQKEGTRPVPTLIDTSEKKEPCPPEVLKTARQKLPEKIL